MSMTIALTRNVPARFRGFLASCMLEAAPAVYVSPEMSKAVRERVWSVMLEWASLVPADGAVVLLWRDPETPSGLSILTLGCGKKDLVNHEGVWLSVGELTSDVDSAELERLAKNQDIG